MNNNGCLSINVFHFPVNLTIEDYTFPKAPANILDAASLAEGLQKPR